MTPVEKTSPLYKTALGLRTGGKRLLHRRAARGVAAGGNPRRTPTLKAGSATPYAVKRPATQDANRCQTAQLIFIFGDDVWDAALYLGHTIPPPVPLRQGQAVWSRVSLAGEADVNAVDTFKQDPSVLKMAN